MQEDQAFIQDLIKQINRLRSSPASFAPNLKKYKQEMLKCYSYKTDFLDGISKLTGKLSTLGQQPEVKSNESLNLVAEDLINQLRESTGMKLFKQDEDYLSIALSQEIEGFKIAKTFLNTEPTPEEVLMGLLFTSDELAADKKTILDPSIRYIGVAQSVVKGQLVTITIFTDAVKPVQLKGLPDGLLVEIGKLRANPKSFINYLPQNDKNTKDVTAFLQSTKRFGNLVQNKFLNQIATERAEKYNDDHLKLSYDQLVDYLASSCDKYLNVAEYIAEPKDTARDFIISMLYNKDEGKDILFNKKYSQFGFAQLDSSKPVVLLFVDNIAEKLEKKEVTMLSLRRRLRRPQFTEDETIQMQNDFKSLDVTNTGLIKPEVILLFADKNPAFAASNPFYHTALKNLNTEENNSNGVNSEEFINGVKKAIRDYNDSFPENWPEIYNLYFQKGSKKKMLDQEILKEVIKEMGFKVNDEDIIELLEKIDGDLDQDRFVSIMKMIELRFAAREAMVKVTAK